jgi:putative phosphoribosyl transferase
MRFRDRTQAGARLADLLAPRLAGHDVVVLALPRGGVPVASEIARALDAPLDVIGVRKLGAPKQPEFGIGAIAEGGIRVLDRRGMAATGLDEASVEDIEHREREELDRRVAAYRGRRSMPDVAGRTVIVVDDGLATGVTARAACRAVRRLGPARVILAVPVAAAQSVEAFGDEADEVVSVVVPDDLRAIGAWYDDFGQTTDAEVLRLLDEAATRRDHPLGTAVGAGSVPLHRQEDRGGPTPTAVAIPVEEGTLVGDLEVPAGCRGVVVFAHGSGSSRHSPRNQQVAADLRAAGFATLLVDLLTAEEEEVDVRTRELRFDIGRLATRVASAVDWLRADPRTQGLDVGLFGASTGAAAALVAAAERPDTVASVVSRGGRPDLAGAALSEVHAPTLLIVGAADRPVIGMNEEAMQRMVADVALEIVPEATHLFEEPGALERVARLACSHFRSTLG